ncbi:MAG: protein TolR [Pseudomonadota bacterium]
MHKIKSRARLVSEINVVPYIDVMLVLLVIFMITTPLLTQGVKIHLPKAQAKAIKKTQHQPIIITVDKFGRYYLNVDAHPNKPITPSQLAIRIAAELQLAQESRQNRQVFVKGDENVDYGKVVQAMVLLQHAGVKNIGLVTQSLQPTKKMAQKK